MGENPEDAKIEFIQRGAFLSILRWSILKLKTGPKYSCHQYDFPLKALSWFPKALADNLQLTSGILVAQLFP